MLLLICTSLDDDEVFVLFNWVSSGLTHEDLLPVCVLSCLSLGFGQYSVLLLSLCLVTESDSSAHCSWMLKERSPFFTLRQLFHHRSWQTELTPHLHAAARITFPLLQLSSSSSSALPVALSSNMIQSQLWEGGSSSRRTSCFPPPDSWLFRKWTSSRGQKILGLLQEEIEEWMIIAWRPHEIPARCSWGAGLAVAGRWQQADTGGMKQQNTQLRFLKKLRWLSGFMICPHLQERKPVSSAWPQSGKPHTLT